jgi:hypothetical protein
VHLWLKKSSSAELRVFRVFRGCDLNAAAASVSEPCFVVALKQIRNFSIPLPNIPLPFLLSPTPSILF